MFAGQVDEGNASYVMHWPGLLAVFPWSAHDTGSWQDLQQGRAVPGAQGIGAAPTATRLCIFAGSAGDLRTAHVIKHVAHVGTEMLSAPINLASSMSNSLQRGLLLEPCVTACWR